MHKRTGFACLEYYIISFEPQHWQQVGCAEAPSVSLSLHVGSTGRELEDSAKSDWKLSLLKQLSQSRNQVGPHLKPQVFAALP